MAVGSATLNFGSGSKDVSVAVTGQGGIASGSKVEAFWMGDVTSDHTADEHLMASHGIKLACGSVVAGTGFTIYAQATGTADVTGQFTVNWVWV